MTLKEKAERLQVAISSLKMIDKRKSEMLQRLCDNGHDPNGAKISGFVVVFSGKKTRPHDAR
jgi:hypothetical protein